MSLIQDCGGFLFSAYLGFFSSLRISTWLENLEMSWNLTAVRDVSEIDQNLRKFRDRISI